MTSDRRRRIRARGAAAVALALAVAAAGCGGTSSTSGSAAGALHWSPLLHVPAVVDITNPRADGSVVVAAMGHLSLFAMGNSPQPFAGGADGYQTAIGPEPYIALASSVQLPAADCSFNQDDVYALEPSGRPGVVKIDGGGRATRFADLPGGLLPDGIAFDGVGRFGHRLVITATGHGATTVFAVDCRGGVSTLTTSAPTVEGGIAIAPVSFGRFAGDLVAPDELSGRILAVDPDGHAVTLAKSGLPSGGDIGVESAGFVPADFGTKGAAYLADRSTPGNPHPGTDSILELSGSDLGRAGVHPGDLLVASEGGAQTVVVRCDSSCTVGHIANGPSTTHGEGHIAFAS